MTPVSQNTPECPSTQGQNQPFNVSPNNQDSRALFNTRKTIEFGELRENDHHQGDKLVLHDGSSSNHQLCNSPEPVMHDPSSARDPNLSLGKMEGEGSKNGHGSTKMRLRERKTRPNSSVATTSCATPSLRFQSQGQKNQYSRRSNRSNNSSTTRVCLECNASTTPLWRSGPMGPKSLCNACGIRHRKAAMGEATNSSATPIKTTVNKQSKNKYKSTTNAAVGSSQCGKKPESFATGLRNDRDCQQQEFPSDEVVQAALLLMAIARGFVYS